MIKEYQSYPVSNYFNIFHVIWYLIVTEYHELLTLVGAYDRTNQTYNEHRRWVVTILATGVFAFLTSLLLLLFGILCVMLLPYLAPIVKAVWHLQ